MNLETKLNNSLNDILKVSGYIFEIINNNKKSSNLIVGSNNQLISPTVINQLSKNIARFDEILDETVCKFNDAKWCVEQMMENKREEEVKAEQERQAAVAAATQQEQERIRKLEEERKQQQAQELAAKAEEERKQNEAKAQEAKQEEERVRKQQEQQREMAENAAKSKQEQEKMAETNATSASGNDGGQDSNNLDLDMSNFDFDLKGAVGDIPNPNDILSSINYNDKDGDLDGDTNMNALLSNDSGLLDGLNMNLLDGGFDVNNPGPGNDEDFDVDNFLNQFGGD